MEIVVIALTKISQDIFDKYDFDVYIYIFFPELYF